MWNRRAISPTNFIYVKQWWFLYLSHIIFLTHILNLVIVSCRPRPQYQFHGINLKIVGPDLEDYVNLVPQDVQRVLILSVCELCQAFKKWLTWKKRPTKKRPTITKMTDHNKNDRPWNATDFCHRYLTGSTRKMVRDYGGLYALLLYIGPHADVTGLVGKCELFMDVANKTTSMICFGLTRMFLLSGANYSGQRPLYPWITGT